MDETKLMDEKRLTWITPWGDPLARNSAETKLSSIKKFNKNRNNILVVEGIDIVEWPLSGPMAFWFLVSGDLEKENVKRANEANKKG